MSNEPSSAGSKLGVDEASQDNAEYRTINFAFFLVMLSRRRKTLLTFSIIGFAVAAAAAYSQKPQFDAIIRFLPPAQREVSPLSSLMPSAHNQGDQYLGLVSSRTVADDVIERQHLGDYFHTKKLSETRARLKAISKIVVDKNQFVTITVRVPEPERAVSIANEYLDALYRLNHSISVAEATHRWEFFEGPLEQEKNRLADAEDALTMAQRKTGVVSPETQVRLGASAIAELQQQIATREVQLASLRMGGTEENPQIIQLKSQIANLHGQVEKLQQQTSGKGNADSTAQLTALSLEVERKMREVKFHEKLFDILSRQYENARVDESYTPSIELVDRAVLPDQKAWPPRRWFILAGIIGGWLLGVFYVCLQAAELPRRWKKFLLENELKADATGH